MSTTSPVLGAVRYLGLFRRLVGRRIYVVFALATLSALMEGLGIAMIVPLLGAVQGVQGPSSETGAAIRELISFIGVVPSLETILAVIVAAFLLKAGIGFASRAYGAYLQTQLVRELRAELFDAYGRMNYKYYSSKTTGHFVNVISGQVDSLFSAFSSYVDFLTRLLQAVVYISVALWLSWRVGLAAFIFGTLVVASFKKINSYVREVSRRLARTVSELSQLFVQSIQNLKYLASTNQLNRARPAVIETNRRVTGFQLRHRLLAALTRIVAEPVSVMFIASVVYIQVAVLELPVEPILVVLFLFHKTVTSSLAVQGHWQQMSSKMGSVEMVEAERRRLRSHRERSGTTRIAAFREGVTFQNVSFAYSADAGEVLRSVSLDFPARATVALVGESGAGKSTTVDLLTLLLRPTEGEILIDGVPSREIDLASWRSKIGYVSQDTVVFDDTIVGNIVMGDVSRDAEPKILSRAREAAARANIIDFVEGLPDGFFTTVGDRGIRLSGGQRQRLSIARELFRRPELLILDEATSSLDTESERRIQQSIDALRGQLAMVLIAHRLSTIKNADIVYVLDRGEVIERGSYAALRSQADSRLHELIKLQQL